MTTSDRTLPIAMTLARSGGLSSRDARRQPVGRAPRKDAATPEQDRLRVALFSGNYNMVRDGANKALNRLVRHLIDKGAEVRVYSPTVRNPDFEPAGHLVSVPSVAIPGRSEYRVALGLTRAIRQDLTDFAPNLIHLSSPDLLGRQAQRYALDRGIPLVASLHTLFETYLSYYGLGALRGMAERYLRRFYGRCDHVLIPHAGLARERCVAGLDERLRPWGRGVDRAMFDPARRDLALRRELGYADDEMVLLFFGRIVIEKGLTEFAETVARLRDAGHKVRPMVIGTGPAEAKLRDDVGEASFLGYLAGAELGRAVASADILLNPSTTEAFGNVNLEAMASGLAVVSADVPNSRALIRHGETGFLTPPDDAGGYAAAVEQLLVSPALRFRLGANARTHSASFLWESILDEVINTYKQALAKHGLTLAATPEGAIRRAA